MWINLYHPSYNNTEKMTEVLSLPLPTLNIVPGDLWNNKHKAMEIALDKERMN